ncbi:MAG: RNA polymerase sigma factor [Chitinophagaceae bacterium]|nr:RNA polymerase sigma factor [Chitinophagaceae bacterium]
MTTTNTSFSNEGTIIGAYDLDVLVQQCKLKDKKAQKRLYDLFAPLHYAKIRRYVCDTQEANEILNESFFKIFTSLENYAAAGSFEGWMHRVTINTTLDYLRKQKKYQNINSDDASDLEIPIPETSIANIAYKELLSMVHSLPDVQRSVFNLFVLDDCSHKEIAALLDITENNSRWHLNDARRRLKLKIDALK